MTREKDKEAMLPTIIAVDFDGTLVENCFPEIGEIKHDIWSAVVTAKEQGSKIILWTNRTEEYLIAAVQFCSDHGLVFDAINDNIPEVKALGWNARKVFATCYLDDRMGVVFEQQILPINGVTAYDNSVLDKWIPIAPDSMPPKDEEVFLWELMKSNDLSQGFLRRGYYDGHDFRYYNTDALCYGTVTHWMPFIQPPRA